MDIQDEDERPSISNTCIDKSSNNVVSIDSEATSSIAIDTMFTIDSVNKESKDQDASNPCATDKKEAIKDTIEEFLQLMENDGNDLQDEGMKLSFDDDDIEHTTDAKLLKKDQATVGEDDSKSFDENPDSSHTDMLSRSGLEDLLSFNSPEDKEKSSINRFDKPCEDVDLQIQTEGSVNDPKDNIDIDTAVKIDSQVLNEKTDFPVEEETEESKKRLILEFDEPSKDVDLQIQTEGSVKDPNENIDKDTAVKVDSHVLKEKTDFPVEEQTEQSKKSLIVEFDKPCKDVDLQIQTEGSVNDPNENIDKDTAVKVDSQVLNEKTDFPVEEETEEIKKSLFVEFDEPCKDVDIEKQKDCMDEKITESTKTTLPDKAKQEPIPSQDSQDKTDAVDLDISTQTIAEKVEEATEKYANKEKSDTPTPNSDSLDLDISLDQSAIAINKDHGLNKPDCMIEIPTQELIDFDGSFDMTDNMSVDDISPQQDTPETHQIDLEITVSDLVSKNHGSQATGKLNLTKVEEEGEKPDNILENVNSECKTDIVQKQNEADKQKPMEIEECKVAGDIDNKQEVPMELAPPTELSLEHSIPMSTDSQETSDVPTVNTENSKIAEDTKENEGSLNTVDLNPCMEVISEKLIQDVILSSSDNLIQIKELPSQIKPSESDKRSSETNEKATESTELVQKMTLSEPEKYNQDLNIPPKPASPNKPDEETQELKESALMTHEVIAVVKDSVEKDREPKNTTDIDSKIIFEPDTLKESNETSKEIKEQVTQVANLVKESFEKNNKPIEPTDSLEPGATKELDQTNQDLKDSVQMGQETISGTKSADNIAKDSKEGTPKESTELATKDSTTKHHTIDAKPSTSMVQDEEEEVMDSLGLLAESSRVMEDDEDHYDDDEADDDDDFEADDDSSHHAPTAEHSEDSNPQPSETDAAKDAAEVDATHDAASDEKEQDGDMDVDVPDDTNLTEVNEIDIEEHSAGVEIEPADTDEAVDVTPKLSPNKRVLGSDSAIVTAVESDKDDKSEGKSESLLRGLLLHAKTDAIKDSDDNKCPSEEEMAEVTKCSNILGYVDLGESSEEDVKEKQEAVDKMTSKVDSQDMVTITESGINTDDTAKTSTDKNNEIEAKQKNEEVFNLDSDNEETEEKAKAADQIQPTLVEQDEPRGRSNCINHRCTSNSDVVTVPATAADTTYYNTKRKKRPRICLRCRKVVSDRTESLVEGIKNLTPILELQICKNLEELVEISDSDSDDENDIVEGDKVTIGEKTAQFLSENLADVMNETWCKYDLDSRLKRTQDELESEINNLESECAEIDSILSECQSATDKLRHDLYSTFEQETREISGIHIYDTGITFSVCSDASDRMRLNVHKRKSSSSNEPPAKRTASDTTQDGKPEDDSVDVCVVKLSGEAAPAGLPPPGELARPAVRHNMPVYAMRNSFGAWLKATVFEIQPKGTNATYPNFTVCKVRFDHKQNKTKLLPARCLAYEQPASVRLTIGTRIIALFKDEATLKKETYYSGIVAEIPNPVNSYRYLVFFDDGYAQYVHHKDTRLVIECSPLVWEEVHPFSRQFVREYLIKYPERPMVRLHANQTIKTEWNGKWWVSRVVRVDASLVQVQFSEDARLEWVYRGSTRLAPLYLELRAAERHRARPVPHRATNNKQQNNMPYVEYTRTDEQGVNKTQNERASDRQRSVAKKSTTHAPPQQMSQHDTSITSRVVYYTPKNAVKPYKMSAHACSSKCVRSDVLGLKELRTYNPLAKPLLSGWERQLVKFKGSKEVMYRAPCGRRLRNMKELHNYLNLVNSEMSVDLFDFSPSTHCLAEFVLNKCLVSKKDLSHGKENVPVPCVNYYDESLPEFMSYNTERTPTAGVPLNLDPDFLCGCDCTDDCQDKRKCACWQMTLEGARTIGLEASRAGYHYKRLLEPLPSGIYECNSRCKCKNTCLNRVAQHPLQLKLQVFKTLNRGWGIRALNDVPKGSFLCVYAGNLLTDATANLDGLNEGDEYLAELDYIEVVEQMKEGYEEDIPDADKQLDRKDGRKSASDDDDEDELTPSEDDGDDGTDKSDGDFKPDRHISKQIQLANRKSLRKRDKKKEKEKSKADDCITISDDEELREPSRFMADAEMKSNDFISKYKSVRTLFGKDEACYIMDAKVQGNIGRYLNHSCLPNVFVQNVFVDSHDPRFPWVAFFASSHIKAGTELTWNYNYDIGSVPGKVLYCYCGAQNCRGRLL